MRKDGSYQWRLLIAESVVEENRPGKTGRVVWPSDQRKTRQTWSAAIWIMSRYLQHRASFVEETKKCH